MPSEIISVLTVVCIISLDTGRQYLMRLIGSPLYGHKIKPDGELNEVTVVRAGIFDDIEMLDQRKPEAELFCGSRLKWMKPIEGAAQFSGMPPFL